MSGRKTAAIVFRMFDIDGKYFAVVLFVDCPLWRVADNNRTGIKLVESFFDILLAEIPFNMAAIPGWASPGGNEDIFVFTIGLGEIRLTIMNADNLIDLL